MGKTTITHDDLMFFAKDVGITLGFALGHVFEAIPGTRQTVNVGNLIEFLEDDLHRGIKDGQSPFFEMLLASLIVTLKGHSSPQPPIG